MFWDVDCAGVCYAELEGRSRFQAKGCGAHKPANDVSARRASTGSVLENRLKFGAESANPGTSALSDIAVVIRQADQFWRSGSHLLALKAPLLSHDALSASSVLFALHLRAPLASWNNHRPPPSRSQGSPPYYRRLCMGAASAGSAGEASNPRAREPARPPSLPFIPCH